MRPREITDAARRLIDKPYHLGDTSRGYDCLSMVLDFYRGCGVKLPEEFRGFTRENYAERWKRGEGRQEIREFYGSLGRRVDVNYALPGDLMIYEWEDTVTAGIYLGNGHALMCFEKGLKVVPFRFFKSKLIEVRRCLG